MAELGIRIEAKMVQSMRMTPRLQQAIKLLQFNSLDMVQHVQEAMLENPALEVVPDSEGSESFATPDLVQKAADTQNDLIEQRNGNEGSIDWEKFLEQMSDKGPRQPGSAGTIHDELPPIETNLTYGESLADHLIFQLQMVRCGEDERLAAEAIVHNLDDRGYLALSLEELASDVGIDIEVMGEALEIVQGLDPIGCGARNLVECLVLQARHIFPEDDNFERILRKHLQNLERRNYQAIAKDLSLDLEDVIEYHKMIQELDPLPGRGFSGEDPRYITPDIYVEKHNDEWVITLNEDGLPDLRISKYYSQILCNAPKSDADLLKDRLRKTNRMRISQKGEHCVVLLGEDRSPNQRIGEYLSKIFHHAHSPERESDAEAEVPEAEAEAEEQPPQGSEWDAVHKRLLAAPAFTVERREVFSKSGRIFQQADPEKNDPEWIVTVEGEPRPDLALSEHVTDILRSALVTDKEYLLDKLRGAEFLIKSINKRRRTIRSVMESILKFQRDFFEHGVDRLRPLVLQDVADDVGVHMSTVSRATTNKYVDTPHGLFELKFFFSQAVKQQTGGDMAAEAIKNRIRQLVSEEDGKNPLSDQQIADALKKDGISVARRTVAKYRESMGILPSSKRKQMF